MKEYLVRVYRVRDHRVDRYKWELYESAKAKPEFKIDWFYSVTIWGALRKANRLARKEARGAKYTLVHESIIRIGSQKDTQ